jgi:hypothetical protein
MTPRHRQVAYLLSGVACIASAGAGAQAPPPAQPPAPAQSGFNSVPAHPFFSGLPGIEQIGAPEWIQPGTRLIFWGGAGTTISEAGQSILIPDPNGDLVDEVTGEKFRESTVSAGAAGAGYTVIDIAAVTPQAVVADVRMYLIDPLQNTTQLTSFMSLVTHPSSCDWWVNPALIAMLREGRAHGVRVLRGPYAIGQQVYDAVRIVSGGTSYTYDTASGVMLSFTMSSSGAGGGVRFFDPNTGKYETRQTTAGNIALGRFVATRQVNLPWANQAMPAWANAAKSFHYDGAYTTAMPGVQPMSLGLTMDSKVLRRGENWIETEVTSQLQNIDPMMPQSMPSVSLRISAPAMIGGQWMSPDALAQLQQNQVIDEDPFLNTRAWVSYAGPDQQGRNVVAITESGVRDEIAYLYDVQTGMMIAAMKTDRFPETQTTVTLQIQLTGQN